MRKVLAAFAHILADAPAGKERDELVAALRADGFTVEDNGAIRLGPVGVPVAALDVADPEAMHAYERRIQQNVVDDPDLAIGSSKELIEAVCNQLLEDAVAADPLLAARASAARKKEGSLTRLRRSTAPIGAALPPGRTCSTCDGWGEDLRRAVGGFGGALVC